MAREACWSTENNDLPSARNKVNLDSLLKITVDHWLLVHLLCKAAHCMRRCLCKRVSTGQRKDVMHEGPLLTDDAEKLMPTLAPFDQQLDELLKLLSRTDYAGETVG